MTLVAGRATARSFCSARFSEAELIGVDTSEAMLAHARLRAPKAQILQTRHRRLVAGRAAQSDIQQCGAAFPAESPQTDSTACGVPRARRRARRADAVERQRILPCADAHGRGGGALVVTTGAGGQDATLDRFPRRLLRMAETDLVRGRVVDDHLHLCVRQRGRRRRLLCRLRPSTVPRTAFGRRRCAFLGRYREGLREAYPPQSDGKVLLPYPRLFLVAVRRG